MKQGHICTRSHWGLMLNTGILEYWSPEENPIFQLLIGFQLNKLLFFYFQEEIQLLRQKLKETEMGADQDRFLKVKLSEDSTNLARENAALNQQMMDLKKQLDRVRYH